MGNSFSNSNIFWEIYITTQEFRVAIQIIPTGSCELEVADVIKMYKSKERHVALTMGYSRLCLPVWEVSVYYTLSENMIDLTDILMQNSFSAG